jgi:hypothetical protein
MPDINPIAEGVNCEVGDVLIINGDRAVSDNPYHSGTCSWKLYRNGKLISFQYYYVGNFSSTKCLRLDAGWKLWNVENNTKNTIVVSPITCQLVFTPGINNKG